jgi:hypothetical protein
MSPPNSAIAGENSPLAASITPPKNMALVTGRVSHADTDDPSSNYECSESRAYTLKLNLWYTLFALNTAVVLCGPSGSMLL